MKNNILLISNNTNVSKDLGKKLVLLRNCDIIKSVDFNEALSILDSESCYIIFLYSNSDYALIEEQLKAIKIKSSKSSVILVLDKEDADFIMGMYDLGIDGYLLVNSNPAEVLIKTVNLIKLNMIKEKAELNQKLLEYAEGISFESGFYTENYANEVMDFALAKSEYSNSVFMILTYDELDSEKFSYEELVTAVKTSKRYSDIVIELPKGKFYILLSDSDCNGAVRVFEKIKEALSGNFRIKAGICEIHGKNFKDIEQRASLVLNDAMLSASDYVISEEKELLSEDDWTLGNESVQKDFKIFRHAYNKKLEKVITPVFFQMKEAYEGQLAGTVIEEFTNENQCIFNLKSRTQKSRLTLVYPGLGKVVIYITHSGLDSPENKEIVLSLKELTKQVLVDLIEIFINDYKTCIDRLEAE